MSPARNSAGLFQGEAVVVEVLVFLRSNPDVELSYDDIAKETGIRPVSRLKRAVPEARAVAEHLGDRLEVFGRSTDPRRREQVTRYKLSGTGDAFGARDAIRTSLRAVRALKDMRRSCDFEARNKSSISGKAFRTMANAADECIKTVTGVPKIGPQVTPKPEKTLLLQHVTEMEAMVAEAAAS